MIFPVDLIRILKHNGFIKWKEAGKFHKYIVRSKEETLDAADALPTTPEDIRLEKTLVSRVRNLSVFLEILSDVEKLLKVRLTAKVFDRAVANCPKTLAYIIYRLPDDPVEKEEKTQWVREILPEEVLERTIFDMKNIDEDKECIFIPADFFHPSPTRDMNTDNMILDEFGTPYEIILRKEGLLKGKRSIMEYRYHVRQMLHFRIFPALDEGSKEGILRPSEFTYIKKFVSKILHLMVLYQGVKKGDIDMKSDKPLVPSMTNLFSNKMIENHIENLIKGGFDPLKAEAIKAAAFKSQERLRCINPQCGRIFIPINKNHKRCEHCSRPENYLKDWRASKANNRNEQQKQPAPQKDISIPMISSELLKKWSEEKN